MKPITNILLIIYIVVYTFLPIFDVSLVGGQTGFDYTSHTISTSVEIGKQLFSLLPFIVAFSAMSINCLKNRYWGVAVAAIICLGLYFYIDARDFAMIQQPEFFKIDSLGVGYYIGFSALLLSLASAILSVLPFKFNRVHAREAITKNNKKQDHSTDKQGK